MFLKQINDENLAQYAYLIACQRTGEAVVIEPERDIDQYLRLAEKHGFQITGMAETHIHADFLSGSLEFLAGNPEGKVFLSDEGTKDWKYEWASDYPNQVKFLHDGDSFGVGKIKITALHTPGHTPEHLSFLIEDTGGGANEPMALISGDFIFVGDVGRPDLLESAAGQKGAREPSARQLFRSLEKFQALPDFVQILPGHGAGSACGKDLGAIPSSTVGYEKRFNRPIVTATREGEDAFVAGILDGQPEPPPYFARMKQWNKLGAPVLAKLPEPEKISPKKLLKELEQNPNMVVLDNSRSNRRQFMDAHLPGSLFAPSGANFSVVAGSYLEPDQPIVLMVEDAEDRFELTRQLIRIGYDKVHYYTLLEDWESDREFREMFISTPTITTQDLHDELQSFPHTQVLDVRSAAEFNTSHVEGAIRIGHTQVKRQLGDIEAKHLAVHCGSGLRASLAVPYLERKGFRVTYADGAFADYHAGKNANASV